MINIEREDAGKKGRFIIYYNNEEAGEMTYTWAGENKFIIDHTGVKEPFEGKGLGKKLGDESSRIRPRKQPENYSSMSFCEKDIRQAK